MTLITQFSVLLISPILLCVFVAVWIKNRFGTGYWVIMAGIVLGIASMGLTFYKFYKKYTSDKDNDDNLPPQSNRHF